MQLNQQPEVFVLDIKVWHRMHSLKVVLATIVAAATLPQVAAQAIDPPQPELSARPTQNIASSNADAVWRPTPTQQARVEATTKTYFAARDGNKAEEAYGQLSPRQKEVLPFGTYRRHLEDFNAKAGAAQGRQLRALTWYKDTPQAGPGLYVAVDYLSSFTNLALHCGYLVWQEQTEGGFLLIREEANMIDTATMAKLEPGDLERVRSQFRC